MADGTGIAVKGEQVIVTLASGFTGEFAIGSNADSPPVGDRLGYGYVLIGETAYPDYWYTVWHGPIYAQATWEKIVKPSGFPAPRVRIVVNWNRGGFEYFYYLT